MQSAHRYVQSEAFGTLYRTIIIRAGCLIYLGGKLNLSMTFTQATQDDLFHILNALERAA